jgi:CMP-N-acetylneuraminic acid synthetase
MSRYENIVIIPARGGSNDYQTKKTMLFEVGFSYSIAYAKKKSEIVDEIYVSTDDP